MRASIDQSVEICVLVSEGVVKVVLIHVEPAERDAESEVYTRPYTGVCLCTAAQTGLGVGDVSLGFPAPSSCVVRHTVCGHTPCKGERGLHMGKKRSAARVL